MAGLVLRDRRREVAEERRIVEFHDEHRSKTAAKGDSKPDRR